VIEVVFSPSEVVLSGHNLFVHSEVRNEIVTRGFVFLSVGVNFPLMVELELRFIEMILSESDVLIDAKIGHVVVSWRVLGLFSGDSPSVALALLFILDVALCDKDIVIDSKVGDVVVHWIRALCGFLRSRFPGKERFSVDGGR